MDVVSRMSEWIGSDNADSQYVCINCGVDLDRDYRECPDCGKPYVGSRKEVTE
jgi:rRNA maturation endonuclease Nob1